MFCFGLHVLAYAEQGDERNREGEPQETDKNEAIAGEKSPRRSYQPLPPFDSKIHLRGFLRAANGKVKRAYSKVVEYTNW